MTGNEMWVRLFLVFKVVDVLAPSGKIGPRDK